MTNIDYWVQAHPTAWAIIFIVGMVLFVIAAIDMYRNRKR
jgi:hypothetical protein